MLSSLPDALGAPAKLRSHDHRPTVAHRPEDCLRTGPDRTRARRGRYTPRARWASARSSAGQSGCLLSSGSGVRVLPGAPARRPSRRVRHGGRSSVGESAGLWSRRSGVRNPSVTPMRACESTRPDSSTQTTPVPALRGTGVVRRARERDRARTPESASRVLPSTPARKRSNVTDAGLGDTSRQLASHATWQWQCPSAPRPPPPAALRTRAGYRRVGRQREVEADVRARPVGLVDLDRQGVRRRSRTPTSGSCTRRTGSRWRRRRWRAWSS